MKHLTQANHRSITEVLYHLINASDSLDLTANDIEEMMWGYMNQRGYVDDGATDSDRIKAMVDEVNRRDVTLVHCIEGVRNWIEFPSADEALRYDCRQADDLHEVQLGEITG